MRMISSRVAWKIGRRKNNEHESNKTEDDRKGDLVEGSCEEDRSHTATSLMHHQRETGVDPTTGEPASTCARHPERRVRVLLLGGIPMIVNVLRDGTIKEDMTGHIVKYEDAENLYKWMRKELGNGSNKRIESSATVRGCGDERLYI